MSLSWKKFSGCTIAAVLCTAPFAARAQSSSGTANSVTPADATSAPPSIPREFRGLWISSVGNGNWPSRSGLPVAKQKEELLAIFDKARSLNMNAIVLQVRPACDALYQSNIEPWSVYLTGVQGQAPEPFYDPLKFAIREAHKRGLQLHAWLNPYRAAASLRKPLAANHISKKNSAIVKHLDSMLWLEPTAKAAQDYTLSVVEDIVSRYDVDGIHFDDYFYPYASYMKNTNGQFPDDDSWAEYQKSGGKLSRDDWRRAAVDELMHRCYENIKRIRPTCYFGIAPFGIWRPGNPPGIQGMDAYTQLEADSRKWLAEGWVDYMSPQLYWSLDRKAQSFPDLLKWWVGQNDKGRHVWPGISISGSSKPGATEDVIARVEITRQTPGASGEIFFSANPVMHDSGGISTALSKAYRTPAIVPASPWLDSQAPAAPSVSASKSGNTVNVTWKPMPPQDVFLYVIYVKINGSWTLAIAPASGPKAYPATPPAGGTIQEILVSAVDRMGNESAKVPVSF